MKKVRYAAGALGALGLLPATALAAPAAAATRPSAPPGKSVRLAAGKTVRLDASTAVNDCQEHNAVSSLKSIRGYIAFSRATGCVGQVIGHYYAGVHQSCEVTSTEMRVRFYSPGTDGPRSARWVTGTIHGCTVSYRWSQAGGIVAPHVGKVCEEIFSSILGTVGVALTSAVCENTGYKG
jgi:hypothetical protein